VQWDDDIEMMVWKRRAQHKGKMNNQVVVSRSVYRTSPSPRQTSKTTMYAFQIHHGTMQKAFEALARCRTHTTQTSPLAHQQIHGRQTYEQQELFKAPAEVLGCELVVDVDPAERKVNIGNDI